MTLSPAHREILSLLHHDIPEDALGEIRRAVTESLYRRITAEADRVWDEKGWTDEDAERMLHTHYRGRSVDDTGAESAG